MERIDEVLCHAPLKRRLEAERGIGYVVEDAVLDAVLKAETDRSLGARPLRRALSGWWRGRSRRRLWRGGVSAGTRLQVTEGRRGEIGVSVER